MLTHAWAVSLCSESATVRIAVAMIMPSSADMKTPVSRPTRMARTAVRLS